MLDLLMKKNVPRMKTMSSIRGAIFILQRPFVRIQRRNAAFMLWSMDQLSDGLLAYLFTDITLCHIKKIKELYTKKLNTKQNNTCGAYVRSTNGPCSRTQNVFPILSMHLILVFNDRSHRLVLNVKKCEWRFLSTSI